MGKIMLTNMTPEERERLAYSEGFIEAAKLLGALSDAQAELHDAEIDRDLYLAALQSIYDGVNAGTLTTGGCMVIAGRVIP
jgi:hypothetical protein